MVERKIIEYSMVTETLVVGRSLLNDMKDDDYDCLPISEALDYANPSVEQIERKTKICFLLGGNELHGSKIELRERIMKVSVST